MIKRIFMTGGTGLVGRWLVKTIQRDLPDWQITILTRSPEKNADLDVELVKGAVETFDFPRQRFDYIVHAAVDQTERLLDMCRRDDATMLYTSSGAVYGRGEKSQVPIPEERSMNLDTDYAIKKGLGEVECGRSKLDVKIARLFTFAGKGQPLDYHYAIGNFIRDGLKGGPIVLRGGGEIYRSYMHYSEMAAWLLDILVGGKAGRPYNVGSEQAITIRQLAYDVADAFGLEVQELPAMVDQNEWYVPRTLRVRSELGLVQTHYYPNVLHQMIQEVGG